MPFFDKEILKREVKDLPKVAGYSAVMVAVCMLLQIEQRDNVPLADYIPTFLRVSLQFTLLFFVLGCAYSLIKSALQRKKSE